MHLLQSDSANESTENVHAFNIIAANGPLRRWGGGVGGWEGAAGQLTGTLQSLVGSASH